MLSAAGWDVSICTVLMAVPLTLGLDAEVEVGERPRRRTPIYLSRYIKSRARRWHPASDNVDYFLPYSSTWALTASSACPLA
jgi:hypothetical protein